MRKTGENVYTKKYEESNIDDNLISGFLSALQNFVAEVSSGDVIRTIKTGNVKFIYNLLHDIIVVVVADKDEDEKKIQEKVEKISETFYSKFKNELENWTGDVSGFKKFDEDLEDIISGTVKISLIGFGGVGKTTILKLLKNEEIPLKHNPTIAVDIKPFKEVNLSGVKLIIWDFAGQERFESLWKMLVKGSDLIIVVVDSTMINLLKTRRKIMKLIEEENPNAKVIVIANKQDLPKAIKPNIIEGILNAPTYGFVAIDPSYRREILKIINEKIDELSKMNKKESSAAASAT
ncbi:MAG: ADP-ribosylation factor-like protein [Candidatus Odinarchaeum yellowstonii]|uniref:ADP-ribosylation factor-like protein n=1 Tax=Odinarchaeota yellowstonii (strain LCB_4) TaxID=1841599 RepID=A0AAF0IB49_ODILC|nr:MAG: ADP-ribosylation factor-like protein [Candidatus Odinarchaeum yellowstonii]